MSRRARWLAGALLLAYGVFTAWAWAGAPAVRTDDTDRFYPDRWLDLSGVLDPLNGGVSTAFLYAVVHEPVIIGGVQVFAFAAASALLFLAIVHRLRGHWTGWLLAVGVLVISLLPAFWSSHLVLASESLLFTAATLWLASVVWLTSSRRGEIGPVFANAAAIAILALVRPESMLALVPAEVVLLIWWARYERSGRVAVAGLASMLPFAAFAGYRAWQFAGDDRWPLRYALHNLVAKESSFREYALARMPHCELVAQGLSGPTPWPSTMALEASLPNACPGAFAWFTSGAAKVTTWVPAFASQSLSGFANDLRGLTLMRWTDDTALPSRVDGILTPGGDPRILLVAALAIGVLVAALAGVRPRVTVLAVLGLIVAFVPLMAYLFTVWAVDGVDFGRHASPFIPLIAVAAIVLPATIPRRAERQRRGMLGDIATKWAMPPAEDPG